MNKRNMFARVNPRLRKQVEREEDEEEEAEVEEEIDELESDDDYKQKDETDRKGDDAGSGSEQEHGRDLSVPIGVQQEDEEYVKYVLCTLVSVLLLTTR
jgi:hypothetical protein